MVEGVDDNLVRLLYFSRARPDRNVNDTQVLRQILEVSETQNALRGITGCLLACNGRFMQILEGPNSNVQTTYGSIARDVRHEDVRLVRVGAATERLFPQWTMCGRELSPTDDAVVDVLENAGSFDPSRLTLDRSVSLLLRIQELQSKHGTGDVLLD